MYQTLVYLLCFETSTGKTNKQTNKVPLWNPKYPHSAEEGQKFSSMSHVSPSRGHSCSAVFAACCTSLSLCKKRKHWYLRHKDVEINLGVQISDYRLGSSHKSNFHHYLTIYCIVPSSLMHVFCLHLSVFFQRKEFL